MSVTVLSPERQKTRPPTAEERRVKPEDTDTSVEVEGFAVPSSSATTTTPTTTSTSNTSNPTGSRNHQPKRRSRHRRAISESGVATCSISIPTTLSPTVYELRGGRKRRFLFAAGHNNHNEQQGSGWRKRHKRHEGGSLAAQYSSTEAGGSITSSYHQQQHHHSSHSHNNGGRARVAGKRTGASGGRDGAAHRRNAHVHQPKAPNNTSSFLIDDLQRRETDEQKKNSSIVGVHSNTDASTTTTTITTIPHHRPRSYSSLATVGDPVADADQPDGDSLEEEDSEFSAEFDNASMERIESLSRTQVNKEMLNIERANRRLYDCLDTLKSENCKLKHLLDQHGITYLSPMTVGHSAHLVGSLSESRSSSTEEGDVDDESKRERCIDNRSSLSD